MEGLDASNSHIVGTVRRCAVADAGLLHRLSVETYVDTFDGTSSDEDMRKFLKETYAEPVLREELANPDSMFFIISSPSDPQTEAETQGGQSGNTSNDSVGSASPADSAGPVDPAGTPAGYMKLNFGDAQVEDMGPGTMEVQRLYIRKAFKGCGFGTQLMNLALDTARERNLRKVWLGVWEHNEPAKRFYAGKGFVRVGQHAFWQGDDKQTDYLMAREV